MIRIGYIKQSTSNTSVDGFIEKLKSFNCEKIFIDKPEDEKKRPERERMLTHLKKTDELVVLRLSNAFRGLRELGLNFEMFRIKKIRLISIEDQIDSKDEIYPASTARFMDVFASLMSEVAIERSESVKKRAEKNGHKLGRPSGSDGIKEKQCVDLYNEGNSIADIMKVTGYRSKSSIFRILRNNGMEPNRRVLKKR